MQEVSKAWKAAQNQTIVPESYLEINLNAGDQNAQNRADASDNGHVYFATTEEITKDTVEPVNFATLEPQLWLLDGKSRITGSDISDPSKDFLGFVPYASEGLITADGMEFYCAKEVEDQEGSEYVPSKIYGVSWDGTSTTQWTRTDNAADFVDPVPYVAGATNYGSPFDNIQPWAGMVTSERDGGTMVAIPKFWYTLAQHNGSGLKIQISDTAQQGFSVSPAHMDRGDGKGERDVVYVGRYHCSDTDFKSRTNVLLKKHINRSEAREGIHALGSTIWQYDFAIHFTIWLLYLVEFADWNSQERIGYGCGSDDYNVALQEHTGNSDAMPYHTGTMQASRNTYGVGCQYRNIEGLWDNAYVWCDGCYANEESGLNIILNPSKFNNTSEGSPTGLTDIIQGIPSAFTISDTGGFPMFYPVEDNGSFGGTNYMCDAWFFFPYSSFGSIYVGGSYDCNVYSGLFYVESSEDDGFSENSCRLQELP